MGPKKYLYPKIIFAFLSLIVATSLIQPQTTLAEENNIYIAVGNSLLNFDGDPEILRNATFNNDNFTIIVQPGKKFKVVSDKKIIFDVSPSPYVSGLCSLNNSSVIVDVPISGATAIITIKPKTEICSSNFVSQINDTIQEIRENPEAQRIVKKVILPISVTVSAISSGALVVTASVGSANFALNLTQILQQLSIFRFYALGFLRFRRKKPWGRVLDKLSGKPIQGVLVQIYENEFKKIKDAQITDEEGRFSAIVSPGKYFLKVSRNGFETQETGLINISGEEQILNLEINISPKLENFSVGYLKRVNLYNSIIKILDLINPYLLGLGTFISFGATIIIPNTINYIGLALYISLDILKIYFRYSYIRPFGRVFSDNKHALPLAVVRVFEKEKNILLGTKVTDEKGQFSFLLAPGKYYLTCSKTGFNAFRSNDIELRESGIAALDIELKLSQSI